MKEKDIEKYLRVRVKVALGGHAYKFTSPGRRSVPDRICVVPNGEVFFVECKRPGEVATPAQLKEHDYLRSLRQWVYVASTRYAVDKIIDFWKRRLEDEG